MKKTLIATLVALLVGLSSAFAGTEHGEVIAENGWHIVVKTNAETLILEWMGGHCFSRGDRVVVIGITGRMTVVSEDGDESGDYWE
jgi:hypothetical protein